MADVESRPKASHSKPSSPQSETKSKHKAKSSEVEGERSPRASVSSKDNFDKKEVSSPRHRRETSPSPDNDKGREIAKSKERAGREDTKSPRQEKKSPSPTPVTLRSASPTSLKFPSDNDDRNPFHSHRRGQSQLSQASSTGSAKSRSPSPTRHIYDEYRNPLQSPRRGEAAKAHAISTAYLARQQGSPPRTSPIKDGDSQVTKRSSKSKPTSDSEDRSPLQSPRQPESPRTHIHSGITVRNRAKARPTSERLPRKKKEQRSLEKASRSPHDAQIPKSAIVPRLSSGSTSLSEDEDDDALRSFFQSPRKGQGVLAHALAAKAGVEERPRVFSDPPRRISPAAPPAKSMKPPRSPEKIDKRADAPSSPHQSPTSESKMKEKVVEDEHDVVPIRKSSSSKRGNQLGDKKERGKK